MKFQRRYPGSTHIWVAICGLLLIAMVGVATDIGYLMWVGQQLQNAADAAALAGAQVVRTEIDGARLAAVNIAAENVAAGDPVQLRHNEGNDPVGDVVLGWFNSATGEFFPDVDSRNAVKVTARRTSDSLGGQVALFFGRMFGITATDISRTAIALSGGGTGAGLIALNPHAPESLRIMGTGVLDVDGGAIQVNSDHDRAVRAGGTITIMAPEMNVGGDVRFIGGAEFEGELHPNSPPLPDPLAALPEPTWDLAADLGTISILGGETVTCTAGYYSGGISANSGTLYLEPGIYILDGAGLNISGNASIQGDGVMIYVVGSGVVDLVGTGLARLTPPDPSYDFPGSALYEGVTIFQSRSNLNPSRITGTNMLDLDGTIYLSSNHVTLSGTGDGFGNQLICDTIEVNGTGHITIHYDGRNPSPGFRSWLVR